MVLGLLWVLLVGALEDPVLSQSGLCGGEKCLILYQQRKHFSGAEKGCRDSGGQLLEYSPADKDLLGQVLDGQKGRFWLLSRSGEKAEGPGDCSSLRVFSGLIVGVKSQPCQEQIDGFVCQDTAPCSALQTRRGARVTYQTQMKMQVKDGQRVPQGTVAEVEAAGGQHPESRHLCASGEWTPAPWSCQVMRGGCDHRCGPSPHQCTCAAGQTLHPNNVTCTADVCASCSGEGRECAYTGEGYECTCRDGFKEENGTCVDNRVCQVCEHMMCAQVNGTYECLCKEGFRVSPKNRTRCEQYCAQTTCPADCNRKAEGGPPQCYCPEGFITHTINQTDYCTDIDECTSAQYCAHTCLNVPGSYRCACEPGFRLHHQTKCVRVSPPGMEQEPEEEEEESGSTPPYSDPASAHPASVPPYVKTGSVLGIAVFMALFAVLLGVLLRSMLRRCGEFQLSSLKQHDTDLFYLQPPTDTYKRLPEDGPPIQAPMGTYKRLPEDGPPIQAPTGTYKRLPEDGPLMQAPTGTYKRLSEDGPPIQAPTGNYKRLPEDRPPIQAPTGTYKRLPKDGPLMQAPETACSL